MTEVGLTAEQRVAVQRREGELLLDAGAGSGKTTVLVERFTRCVLDDGVEVGRILVITFTEKAAAELCERIRVRLRALGADDAARDTEGAWISTIHAFCARVLRTHALAAGLDPAFTVLEPIDAEAIATAAFDAALAESARNPEGAELIAAHGPGPLRAAIRSVHDELRSRGQRRPVLPPVPATDGLEAGELRAAALTAARTAARELGTVAEPGARVTQALAALERAERVLDPAVEELWPGDLAAIALPARNGAAALKAGCCDAYRDALDALRTVAAAGFAVATRDALDTLLRGYAERYAAIKADAAAVDFEDLELLARDLLAGEEIGRRLRARFLHVMVDELQDTNRVQLELIDRVCGGAGGARFMVGDAQQSIYGFRHAEVELFEARGRALGESGGRASLQTNFRTRREILDVLNPAFATALGERFRELVAGRSDAPAGEPRVELHIVDKAADWEAEGLAAPWRLAEARMLARRVRALLDAGSATSGEIVLLTRATTDLAAYERALEAAGVPTYVIGGRGYWSHPQVVEMVGYLRALANPLDEEAWFATLVSPLCGLSLDGLVLVAAAARDELAPPDRARLEAFEAWFGAERRAAAWLGIEALLDRVMERTGYDGHLLALPGGRRRLANVRKLMRLGREYEAAHGTDLGGFVSMISRRGAGAGHEGEAPVEGETLDAVRLMTIHRSKGLEFPVVCVADLGRGPITRPAVVRVGRDGQRLGLRLARAGTGARIAALDYDVLGREQQEAELAEERRLFYVAMTRAKERLILTGAAKMDTWGKGNRGTPVDWIGPALVPELAERAGEPDPFVTDRGVLVAFVSADPPSEPRADPRDASPSESASQAVASAVPGVAAAASTAPPVETISYSSLADYERCAYRFYAERVLGLPPTSGQAGVSAPGVEGPAGAAATERGTLVHELLRELDLRRPVIPETAPEDIRALLEAFAGSELRARLAASSEVRREQPFAFPHAGLLVTGTFDVLAREPGERLLVVDYKTGRFAPYAVQRLIYAIAGLRTGPASVEVLHVFLEAGRTLAETHVAGDLPRLEAELGERTAALRAHRFPVTTVPQRRVCEGCPALGGLCSWPAETAMRPAADRLF